MFDWFITALVLLIGTWLMVSGFITWVYIAFMGYLAMIIFLAIYAHIWKGINKRKINNSIRKSTNLG
nr:MAG TPA: hypothetical protein [Caudoviricetes sp.]